MSLDETEDSGLGDDALDLPPEDLKGFDILIRDEVNLIYEEIKNKLESKNMTLQTVFYGTGGQSDKDAPKTDEDSSKNVHPNLVINHVDI
jgi:hypothetical protein